MRPRRPPTAAAAAILAALALLGCGRSDGGPDRPGEASSQPQAPASEQAAARKGEPSAGALLPPTDTRPATSPTRPRSGFQFANSRERALAVGDLRMMSDRNRVAFTAPDRDAFSPIYVPQGNDWLAINHEPHQTFDAYRLSRPNRPSDARHTLYLAPIGTWPKSKWPRTTTVRDFARVHFGLPVEVLPTLAVESLGVRERTREDGLRQLLAPDLLTALEGRVPDDAFAVLGITAIDLYPADDWNFVFGQASFRQRVGIQSLLRYHPTFDGTEGQFTNPDRQALRRALKVTAHEIGHMFGMTHCTFYQCVMNGSNHLTETDSQPIHLCPVCLRKLHYAVGFDLYERYRQLSRFFAKHDLVPEAEWAAGRAAIMVRP